MADPRIDPHERLDTWGHVERHLKDIYIKRFLAELKMVQLAEVIKRQVETGQEKNYLIVNGISAEQISAVRDFLSEHVLEAFIQGFGDMLEAEAKLEEEENNAKDRNRASQPQQDNKG